MTNIASKLGLHVAVGGTYEHCSLHMAKALDQHHAFSTQRWPMDMGDGQFSRGIVTCQDMYFFAKERSANHPSVLDGTYAQGNAATLPADGDKFVMGEWPTGARLRSIEYFATTAEDGTDNTTGNFPEFADETDYWDNISSDYFDVDVIAAFPVFTLWAEDPDDSDFTPILLMPEAVSTAAKNGIVRSVAGLSYGVNRRKDPLLIVARAEGAVVDNSALFLHATFTEQHK